MHVIWIRNNIHHSRTAISSYMVLDQRGFRIKQVRNRCGEYILLWEFDFLIKNDYFINDILYKARKKDHEKERNSMLKLCIR